MRTIATILTGIALLGLTGCGASPTAAPAIHRVVSAASPVKPVAKPTTSQKSPSVTSSSSAGSTTTAGEPNKTASDTATAPANGSLKLAVAVSGSAPVASLDLKVAAQGDASDTADFPLTIDQGAAAWSQGDVPPGTYVFTVEALASDGTSLGQGTTTAVVQSSKETDVSLDLKVNDPNASASDTASTTTPPASSGSGPGTIYLNVNIQ
ncbi:MAG TPA: hypothetical protein V6D47_00690 [Oscillatoriaceae cyanobacterium]